MKYVRLPFYVKLACVLISVMILGYLAIVGYTVVAPLVFGLLFSILLLPMAGFFERKIRAGRALSALLSIIVLVIFVALLFTLLGAQISNLSEDWPAFKQQVIDSVAKLQEWIAATFRVDTRAQLDYLNETAAKSWATGTTLLSKTLLSVSSLLLLLLFIFLYTFFLLLHRRLLLRFFVGLFDEKDSMIVYDVVHQVQYIIKRYIVGLVVQMALVSTLACSVFYFMGIKYSFLLGLITGIFNIIPYIGIFTALLLTVLITFATSTAAHVLFVIIAVILIHMVDSNYIMPKIVGSKVQINPLVALIGLVVGEMMWGITGMFLSIPVIAIFKVVFDRVSDLQPWGILLGEEEEPEREKPAKAQLRQDRQQKNDAPLD